jgi:large subunit ribosomal protein L4
MKVDVIDTANKKTGQIQLDESVFGVEVRPHLFWEVVRMQLANRRSGTHSTKTVSDVRGSGVKPYKQKGTGQARHGTKRAMNMRGGGIVHGPRPRDYSYKMPKKMVQAALRCALSLRLSEDRVKIVDAWSPKAPSTKGALAVFQKLEARKCLVIGSKEQVNLAKSVRNLPGMKFLPVEGLNVYDILFHDDLILLRDVVPAIEGRLHRSSERAAA